MLSKAGRRWPNSAEESFWYKRDVIRAQQYWEWAAAQSWETTRGR
jgi:hypothetical protein